MPDLNLSLHTCSLLLRGIAFCVCVEAQVQIFSGCVGSISDRPAMSLIEIVANKEEESRDSADCRARWGSISW